MSEISIYFQDGAGVGPVVVLENHFGKCYRCFQERHPLGYIFKTHYFATPKMLPLSEDGTSLIYMKLISEVDLDTVKKAAEQSKAFVSSRYTLARGFWYEVHAD